MLCVRSTLRTAPRLGARQMKRPSLAPSSIQGRTYAVTREATENKAAEEAEQASEDLQGDPNMVRPSPRPSSRVSWAFESVNATAYPLGALLREQLLIYFRMATTPTPPSTLLSPSNANFETPMPTGGIPSSAATTENRCTKMMTFSE